MAGIRARSGYSKEQMYTYVQRPRVGFEGSRMTVYMCVHDHLGADHGAYRRPAGMIESGATSYIVVSGKRMVFLGGAGPVLARAARRAPTRHLPGWAHRPMRAI
jgi:hypothetical protein